MKVRLGFVTNSSSSSFICGNYKKTNYDCNQELTTKTEYTGAFNYTGPYKVNKVTFGEEGYKLYKMGKKRGNKE